MEKMPKPTKDLASEVLNIKARLDGLNLYREFEIITSLNARKSLIMESYDWSDQEFQENGRSGLMDCFGEVLIPALYDETWFRTSYFVSREKPVACRKENKWGMVMPDGAGTIVADFLYDNIFLEEYYSMWSFIIVVLSGRYGFIDIKGNPLTPVDIDEIFHPANDMGKVRKGDRYGFIYYNGDYIEPAYEEIAFSDHDRRYHVKLDGRWGFVDKSKSFRSAEGPDEDSVSDFYGCII
jgi:hypothetical protein